MFFARLTTEQVHSLLLESNSSQNLPEILKITTNSSLKRQYIGWRNCEMKNEEAPEYFHANYWQHLPSSNFSFSLISLHYKQKESFLRKLKRWKKWGHCSNWRTLIPMILSFISWNIVNFWYKNRKEVSRKIENLENEFIVPTVVHYFERFCYLYHKELLFFC